MLDCHFKGTFHNADMPEILRILEYSLDISYEEKGEDYVLSGTGCSSE